MEHAADVGRLDQRGDLAARRRIELAATLAQLGRHERETGARVERRLVARSAPSHDARPRRRSSVEREAALGEPRRRRRSRARPSRSRARARPRTCPRVTQCRSSRVPSTYTSRHRRSTGAARFAHARRPGERAGDAARVVAARRDDVHVADRLAATPQRAGELRGCDVRMRAHHREQPRAFLGAAAGRAAAIRCARTKRDPLEDLLRRLRSVAWKRGDASVARGRLERLDGVDAERLVQLVDLGGAESGDAQQLEQAGRSGGAQLLEIARTRPSRSARERRRAWRARARASSRACRRATRGARSSVSSPSSAVAACSYARDLKVLSPRSSRCAAICDEDVRGRAGIHAER